MKKGKLIQERRNGSGTRGASRNKRVPISMPSIFYTAKRSTNCKTAITSHCITCTAANSRRHDRIVDAVYQTMRRCNETSNLFCSKMAETALPDLRTELQQTKNKKPDIIEIKSNNKVCKIIEVTVCFDLYMPESYRSKYSKYQQLKEILQQNGIRTSIQVLCFGSLGTVHQEVRKNLRKLGLSDDEAKSTIKWCSVSTMVCGNMIWRNRCTLMNA